MKRFSLIAACALCLFALSATVKAGPFNLDNLSHSAGAFDVDDNASTPPAAAAPAPKAPAAPSTAAVNAARRALNRRNAPTNATSTDAALGQTRQACSNGQCGRN